MSRRLEAFARRVRLERCKPEDAASSRIARAQLLYDLRVATNSTPVYNQAEGEGAEVAFRQVH